MLIGRTKVLPLFVLLLMVSFVGCVDEEDVPPWQLVRFEATYENDQGEVRSWALGTPAVARSATELGSYLPLNIRSGGGDLIGVQWLDRDLRVVRDQAVCRNDVVGLEDECAESSAFWEFAGGPPELCLDVLDMPPGTHTLQYDLAGVALEVAVVVEPETGQREIRVAPESLRVGIGESRCEVGSDGVVPKIYEARDVIWKLRDVQVGEPIDRSVVQVPAPGWIPEPLNGFKWFPGEMFDAFGIGYTGKEILDAFVEQHDDGGKLSEGACLGLFKLRPSERGEFKAVPGVKLGEGEIRLMDRDENSWQWSFGVYRGVRGPEVRVSGVESDSRASCVVAESPRVSLEDVLGPSTELIQRGGLVGYSYEVIPRPLVRLPDLPSNPYFMITYRPDYKDPNVSGGFTPYQVKLNAAEERLVHVVLHPEDMERLDSKAIVFRK